MIFPDYMSKYDALVRDGNNKVALFHRRYRNRSISALRSLYLLLPSHRVAHLLHQYTAFHRYKNPELRPLQKAKYGCITRAGNATGDSDAALYQSRPCLLHAVIPEYCGNKKGRRQRHLPSLYKRIVPDGTMPFLMPMIEESARPRRASKALSYRPQFS